MTRARGDGGISWDEKRQRWIASTTIGYDGRGKRIVRRASGRTEPEARRKLRELLRDRDDGLLIANDGYTVGEAVQDWLYLQRIRFFSRVAGSRLVSPDIVVSLLTGARTEELRALRWEHVHLDGYPDSVPAVPAFMGVWRSVREGGETKTRKSRRTLALPARCVEALKKQRVLQVSDQLAAGERWQECGLVFTTTPST